MKTPIALDYLHYKLAKDKASLNNTKSKSYSELKRKDEVIDLIKNRIENVKREIEILESL